MTEEEVVKSTTGLPATADSIASDLGRLGVESGMLLLVHTSLSAMGWVCGRSQAVILALEKAVGPHGTIVMPAFSSDWTEPSGWQHPPVPGPWWQVIRDNMPAFSTELTPTRNLGETTETFRKHNGVLRSYHPAASFAACGPLAEKIVADHPLDYPLGENSPLAKIYDLDGWVLFLGTVYATNSSMHLAEYRTDYPGKVEKECGGAVMEGGKRRWVIYRDLDLNSDIFPEIGADFERETSVVKAGKVADAECRLFPQRDCVDFTVEWLSKRMPGRIRAYDAR